MAIIFVIGLCVGSFVNMLVYRTAVQYKITNYKLRITNEKRSFCDYCGRQLRWYENVPVVSWLVQRGKTKCCGKKLDWSYPLVEMGVGILFIITDYQLRITNYHFGAVNYWQLGIGLVIITLLVFSAVFDAKYMILPDFSTLILVIIAFLGVLFDERNILPYLVSAAGAAGFLLFLHILTKGKGMGMGDVKLAFFMGMLLGWPKVVMAFYVAFISGAIVGGAMLLIKKLKRKSLIPFGPFLILGTIVAWWWGENINKFIIFNF